MVYLEEMMAGMSMPMRQCMWELKEGLNGFYLEGAMAGWLDKDCVFLLDSDTWTGILF